MSATIMPIHLKDGTYLQITFMKYDQYCPPILGVNTQNILFHIFSVKLSEKAKNPCFPSFREVPYTQCVKYCSKPFHGIFNLRNSGPRGVRAETK